ncbi:hypothetical protein [Nonomuraea turcica]|uniref:hypothetical protein n=1 Tax=Nonomuraea sp. G32 TaxID=3067274 RepID=UPI00273C5891|nr:hypothetical protein [Nonomuraea sp. G32]MDP4510679.1 hypothetical protein [Nonomuraea sp. G32]
MVLLERLVAHDPAVQAGQPVFVNSELFAPGKPLPTVGGFWDRLAQQAQALFDLDQNSGNPAAEVAKGAFEGTAGLAGMLWEFSEVRKTFDPDGWARQVEDSAHGLIYGIQHPTELLKAITDWDTWTTNPERAFGRLTPDLLMAAATAGGSGAASGASRAASAVDKIADLIKVAKAKAGPQVGPAQIKPDGTWEWKGFSLDPEANVTADRALARAKDAEPEISSGVQSAARQIHADMEGFPEHVLKGPDRYKEKLAKLMRDFPDRTPEELIRTGMHDGIRYTFTFSEDRYAKGVADAKKALEQQGFELIVQKPSWSDASKYKGVNTRWRGPDGQLFEVQMHTPSSLWAKEVTHEIYEYKENLPPQDKARLEKYEAQIFEAVPEPPGVRDIPYVNKED